MERDGTEDPICVNCIALKWFSTKGFIKPKHNPLLLPWSMKAFRSVVTYDFVTNKNQFISTIANTGTYFFDQKFGNFSCVLNQPLGQVSGSAIPANYPFPTHPLGSIVIADVLGHPHVFAEDTQKVNYKISTGVLSLPSICTEKGCQNYAEPGYDRCSNHHA
jgi:hypothetical protein